MLGGRPSRPALISAGAILEAGPSRRRLTPVTPRGAGRWVPLRDMQYAMRHADSRTTLRYDMARANLDRQAVAACRRG